jgi:hypothetical protein
MTNYHNVNQFLNLRPEKYGFLLAMTFERHLTDSRCSLYLLDMLLCDLEKPSSEKLHLKFYDVVDVNIRNIESMAGILLAIEDVSDRQLEGVKYRVSDQENEIVSFFCSQFSADLIHDHSP